MGITLKQFGVKRKVKCLENGIKLVVFEKPEAPIHIRAIFAAGARFDPIGKEGRAHFLEHMLLAGTKRFPTKDKLANYIEKYGGEFGGSTSAEVLNLILEVPDPGDFEVCFEVMQEILLNSNFEGRVFETERGSILNELSGKKSSPNSMLWELYPYMFFQGLNMSRSILGTEESISSIKLEDLKSFYKRYITSENLTLIVFGGVKFEEVLKMVEKFLLLNKVCKNEEAKETKETSSNSYRSNKRVFVEKFENSSHTHILFGFRTEAQDPIENIALQMISERLGSGRSSVFSKKLRYEKGLVYGQRTLNINYRDVGAFLFQSSTLAAQLQEVMDIVCSEFSRVAKNGLTNEEVDFIKMKMTKSLRNNLQMSSDWVNIYSYWERGVNAPFGIENFVKTIELITNKQIKDAAAKYFNNNNWYLGLCGDVDENSVKIKIP